MRTDKINEKFPDTLAQKVPGARRYAGPSLQKSPGPRPRWPRCFRHPWLTLYKSMVRSQLEYCSPLWNPVKISDIQTLEGVQRTFTSRIAGCYQLNYWERLKKLSLMSLQRRRERYIIIHMWKLLHGLSSNDLQIQFYQRSRFGTLAKVPSLCKESSIGHQSSYDSSFAVMGPKLWNAIPYHLNGISDLAPFKGKLAAFLLTVPDHPPVKGYSSPNSNSLLAWRIDSSASALWGGHRH